MEMAHSSSHAHYFSKGARGTVLNHYDGAAQSTRSGARSYRYDASARDPARGGLQVGNRRLPTPVCSALTNTG